jgi:GNAT superfamily N-acetyltransferase
MTRADIAACMRLKEAAGWNQTEQDWANVLAIEPEGCWVAEVDGVVAGSTTAVCWGRELAWIGMVLVLPEFRRQGIARALMARAMEYCREREVGCVKLDATDMGRPLYEQFGFVEECLIERWRADTVAVPSEDEVQPVPPRSVEEILDLDGQAFGADRGALLRMLIGQYPQEWVALEDGFAMSRPGSNARFLGPCIAHDTDTARKLVAAILERYPGESWFWDLLPDNHAAAELASEFGFTMRRKLFRMGVGPGCPGRNLAANVNLQLATSGFEYG